jgi:hypothetical protein
MENQPKSKYLLHRYSDMLYIPYRTSSVLSFWRVIFAPPDINRDWIRARQRALTSAHISETKNG